MSCDHTIEDGIYYKLQPLSQNQETVKCPHCDKEVEKPGFFEDENTLFWKIQSILHHLHEDGYLHISNGEEGEIITRQVANQCLKHDTIRQDDILRFIFTNPNLERFMNFDKEADTDGD